MFVRYVPAPTQGSPCFNQEQNTPRVRPCGAVAPLPPSLLLLLLLPSPLPCTQVMDVIEARGLTKRIHRTQNKWTSVKIGIMAWFSRRLRERLLEVSEQLAAKDLEIAQLHFQ